MEYDSKHSAYINVNLLSEKYDKDLMGAADIKNKVSASGKSE